MTRILLFSKKVKNFWLKIKKRKVKAGAFPTVYRNENYGIIRKNIPENKYVFLSNIPKRKECSTIWKVPRISLKHSERSQKGGF